MVPKLNARGTSFKGAAAYLLHDKGNAQTSARVAWVETINLATANPQTAWRVMAATAMDAGRLKEQAGVKRTGRASKEAVLHVSLSWSPDQTPDRQSMAAFARRTLEALKAEDRQAMIICHSDAAHPHVHLLINRVSPADGRLLSSSNEKTALAALALAYEQEGGTIYCKERQANAERRRQGEYVRGEKDIPRPEVEALREAQQQAEMAIPARLRHERPDVVADLRARMKAAWRRGLVEIKESLRPQWAGLYAKQRGLQQRGQEEKSDLITRLAKRVSVYYGASGTSLPFLRESLKGLPAYRKGHAIKQNGERAGLGREARQQVGNVIAQLKENYAQALSHLLLRQDIAGAVKPSNSDDSRDLTPVQQRAHELAKEARRFNATKSTAQDREFEP